MSDRTAVIVPKSADEIPQGLVVDGDTQEEAIAGLFDALGSDDLEPEFELDVSEEAESADESDIEDEEDVEGVEDPDEETLEEDESEETEDEESEETEDESDDGDEEGEGDDEGLMIEVTLPGGEKIQITPEEAAAGYSRTEDYTRKRQADVAEHTEVMQEARGLRDQYAQGLDKLEEMVRANGPAKPDAALRRSNPGEYAAQMREYDAFEASLTDIGTVKEKITEQVTQEQIDAYNAHVAEGWRQVVGAVPEWADEKVSKPALTALRDHMISEHNFTGEEIDAVADPRVLLLMKENYDLRQTRQKTKEKVTERKAKSKRLAPGGAGNRKGGQKRAAKKARSAADQRAMESGSVKDAAAAIELLL